MSIALTEEQHELAASVGGFTAPYAAKPRRGRINSDHTPPVPRTDHRRSASRRRLRHRGPKVTTTRPRSHSARIAAAQQVSQSASPG